MEQDREVTNAVDRIYATEDLLFSMMDQILDDQDQDWNIFVVDDASGRLPARFIRKVLRAQGLQLPTAFVVGSRNFRQTSGTDIYRDYFKYIKQRMGQELRPLIITESSSSGETVEFLRGTMSEMCHAEYHQQVASVAAANNLEHISFVGGTGENALEVVALAFENLPHIGLGRTALKKVFHTIPPSVRKWIKKGTEFQITPPTINNNVGIGTPLMRDQPLVRRLSESERNPDIIQASVSTIDSMAMKYTANAMS